MHGYSKTPLARKLGVKEGNRFLLVHAPTHYFDLFEDFPETVEIVTPTEANESIDFIHLFCLSTRILEQEVLELIPLLMKNGMLWVSWPKRSSSLKTDLNR